MNINNKPRCNKSFTLGYNFEIVKEYRDAEGYVNSKKVEVGFFDADDDGVVDNPDSFPDIVAEDTDSLKKIIFLEKFTSSDGVEDYKFMDNSDETIKIFELLGGIGAYSPIHSRTSFLHPKTLICFTNLAMTKRILQL